jgi:hypothetical protein
MATDQTQQFDPTLPTDDPLAGEVKSAGVTPANQKELDEDERIRKTIGDVYTFVRSQEINRSIASFTFDHYIDTAIRRLRGEGRTIRNAAGEVLETKPPALEALDKLKADFDAIIAKAKERAKQADSEDAAQPAGATTT